MHKSMTIMGIGLILGAIVCLIVNGVAKTQIQLAKCRIVEACYVQYGEDCHLLRKEICQ